MRRNRAATRHVRAALCAAAALLATPAPARADIAPRFTEWFQSLASSAQALADGDAGRAERLARDACEARPSGDAADRCTVALGLALAKSGRAAEGAALVEAGAKAIDPRIRDDVRSAVAPSPGASPPAGAPVPAPATSPAPPSADDPLASAERAVLAARPRDAIAILDAASAQEAAREQPDRAKLLRAWALLQLGRRTEANDLAREVLASSGAEAGTRTGAELIAARVAARAGRFDEAIERYGRLAKQPATAVPGLSAAAAADLPGDAAYLAAWLFFDAGQWSRAARELSRFAAEHPRSPRAADARWFEAWALFRDRRLAEARVAWSRLERTSLAPGALYWQGRVSRGTRARSLYLRAIEAEPGGWYAFLAAGRLAHLGVRASALAAAPAAPAAALPEVPPAAAETMSRASALLELGLRDGAMRLLRGIAEAPGARAAATPLAELAEAAGEAELTLRVARDQLPLSRRALRWQHPLAFGAGLDALASASGADPLLFRALIRRESTFRGDARSGAGAEGLVQLMPYTAERLAALLGDSGDSTPDLRDRSTSLALGAAYLGLLLDRFRDPAAALAAYNGGPEPIAAWATSHARRPLDEAVEELPFRETRRYVKVVMAAYATYRHLHAGARPVIDGSRPVRAPRAGVAF